MACALSLLSICEVFDRYRNSQRWTIFAVHPIKEHLDLHSYRSTLRGPDTICTKLSHRQANGARVSGINFLNRHVIESQAYFTNRLTSQSYVEC